MTICPFGAYFKTLLTIANNRGDGFHQHKSINWRMTPMLEMTIGLFVLHNWSYLLSMELTACTYFNASSHCFVFGMISDVSIFWSVCCCFSYFMLYFLYLSSTPDFSGTCVTWSLVLWACAKDRCLHFFIFVVGHCSVFSSIYPFGIVHFIAICVFSLISTLWIDLH